MHWWDLCVLPGNEHFQHCIINNMYNFTHTTDAQGNGLLYTFSDDLQIDVAVLDKNNKCSSPFLPLIS